MCLIECLKFESARSVINVKDKDGNKPILWACERASARAVKELLKHQAGIDSIFNAQGKDGKSSSAVHFAAQNTASQNGEVITELLKHKEALELLEVRDSLHDKTPADYAIHEWNLMPIAMALRDRGGTVEDEEAWEKREEELEKRLEKERVEEEAEWLAEKAKEKAKEKIIAEPKTLFDKIVNKDIPANILYEDEKALAFSDVNPVAKTHFLVIPKFRNGLDRLESAVASRHTLILGHLLIVAKKVALLQGLQKGYRVVINNGEHGGQTVDHLHLHVIGGQQLYWPPGTIATEKPT